MTSTESEIDTFLRERFAAWGASGTNEVRELFKKLAHELFSDFKDRYGRAADNEEYDAMLRWLATEFLSLGAFMFGGTHGNIKLAIEQLYEEFLLGVRVSAKPSPRDSVVEADATEQDGQDYDRYIAGLGDD